MLVVVCLWLCACGCVCVFVVLFVIVIVCGCACGLVCLWLCIVYCVFVVMLCGSVLCADVRPSVLWHLRLRSGEEHCQAELALDVRQGTLPAEARG